ANVDLETERASVVTISGEKNSRSVSISEDALSLNDSAITVLLGPYTAAVIQVRLKTGPK
ncbi:MAG: hypothetical protein LBF74_14610, partial [Treponema sp.]|nr:hypothetical protein [Treponema sp.]